MHSGALMEREMTNNEMCVGGMYWRISSIMNAFRLALFFTPGQSRRADEMHDQLPRSSLQKENDYS